MVPAAADIPPRSGTATFTDLTGGGACSLPGEPADNLHVGISSQEFGTADVCGAYLDVVGPRGSVRVQITDHCRNCPAGLLDLTRKAFAQIADVSAGRAPVTYSLARNPPLAAPISLRVKDGSSRWWLQIQVLDHGNALASVELASPGVPGWRPLARSPDNFWTAANPGPGDGPFTLRITDIYAQSVVIYDVSPTPAHLQHTVARLYQPTSPPSPTTPSSTPKAKPTPAPVLTTPTPAEPPPSHPRPTTPTNNDSLTPLLAVLAAVALAIYLNIRHHRRPSPW